MMTTMTCLLWQSPATKPLSETLLLVYVLHFNLGHRRINSKRVESPRGSFWFSFVSFPTEIKWLHQDVTEISEGAVQKRC